MSDLGVMIIIKFLYAMQAEENEEFGEMSSPEVGESMPHGDMVQFTVQRIADALNIVEIIVTETPLQQEDTSWNGSLFGTPLHPVKTYSSLDLVHVDFISIQITMELNKPPKCQECISPH